MACNKYLVAVLFASLAFLALSEASNLTVGARQWNDRLIQYSQVKEESKWLRIVKTERTFTGNNLMNITMIQLNDNNKKGNGANATVITGGTGYNFVTIRFRSQRGHSIDFTVEIYGK